jgi:hypothetical protein
MTTPPKRTLTPLLLLAAALATGGCSTFSKKPAAPKENPSIAGQTEDSLRTRWVERRTAELTAAGTAADAARAQAAQEFREKFPHMGGQK